jgi:hypothetical protein
MPSSWIWNHNPQLKMKKEIITLVKPLKQAILLIHRERVIIKLPEHLSILEQTDIERMFLVVASKHEETTHPLRVYYKPGSPLIFVNKYVSRKYRETVAVYPVKNL